MMSPAALAEIHRITDVIYPTREAALAAAADLPTPADQRLVWGTKRDVLRRGYMITKVTRARVRPTVPEMPCADGSPDPYDA